MPREWEKFLKKCSKLNSRWKTVYNGRQMPDPNDEYLFYQTLIGTFNLSEEYQQYTKRISQYMLKAVKEAKEHTGWVDPHFEYEKALSDFIDKALDRDISGHIDELSGFSRKSLPTELQSTPSASENRPPDFLIHQELIDSACDPDNRRGRFQKVDILRQLNSPKQQQLYL